MDITLEREVLATLLLDQDKLAEVLPLLNPSQFSAPHIRWAIKKLIKYYTKYKEIPKLSFFKRRIAKDHHLEDGEKQRYTLLLAKIYKTKSSPGFRQHTIDELREFIRRHELTEIMEKSLSHLERNDVDRAIAEVTTASKIKAYKNEFVICDWLNTWEDRQEERERRKKSPEHVNIIKFPWGTLNKIVQGLQPGESCSIASLTNVGKSITLTVCGKRAVLEGYNVAHFTAENTLWQTNQRYDSAILGIPYDKLKFFKFKPKELALINDIVSDARKLLGSKLRTVKVIPQRTNILTLERAIDEMRQDGFNPQFIIIDSPDQMIPVTKHEAFRLDQSAVYWDIKTLAESLNLPILGSTHVGKAAQGKKALAESLAESYDKARILDVVLTLNQLVPTSAEIIMLVAKNRDGIRNIEIPLIAEFAHMNIREKV